MTSRFNNDLIWLALGKPRAPQSTNGQVYYEVWWEATWRSDINLLAKSQCDLGGHCYWSFDTDSYFTVTPGRLMWWNNGGNIDVKTFFGFYKRLKHVFMFFEKFDYVCLCCRVYTINMTHFSLVFLVSLFRSVIGPLFSTVLSLQ